MSIANAVTLKPVRSVSTSVIKDDSVIVFSFSGGALPSGVTYSGPTNMYVPQSDGGYKFSKMNLMATSNSLASYTGAVANVSINGNDITFTGASSYFYKAVGLSSAAYGKVRALFSLSSAAGAQDIAIRINDSLSIISAATVISVTSTRTTYTIDLDWDAGGTGIHIGLDNRSFTGAAGNACTITWHDCAVIKLPNLDETSIITNAVASPLYKPLFSDEAIYPPAGFTDRNGNKTFSGLTAGVIGSGGVMPTGHSVASSDGSFPLTVEVLGSGTDTDGLPYYDLAIDGTNAAGSTQYATLYLNTAKSVSASEQVTWGCWVKDLDALSHGYMMQVIVTGDTSLNSGSYATASLAAETLLKFSGTLGASATNIRQALVFEVPNTETLNVDIRIKCPQLINKLSLPLCIANGSSDSAIVVTGGACTAGDLTINAPVVVVAEYVGPNGVVGPTADFMDTSNPRVFELASSTANTLLNAHVIPTYKYPRGNSYSGASWYDTPFGSSINLNGQSNKICVSYGASQIRASSNGGPTKSVDWDIGSAELLTRLGIGCYYNGAHPNNYGIKRLTIYPNTEFSAAECQSRSAL